MNPNNQIIAGDIRIQALSDTVLRLEQRGANGFEDRATFTVVSRDFPEPQCRIEQTAQVIQLTTPNYRVILPGDGSTLEGVRVETPTGDLLYQYDGRLPRSSHLPGPADVLNVWVMADSPRLVPPAWGAAPPPEGAPASATSGWDIDVETPDIYLFIPGNGAYAQFRSDFLRLTGPIPLPPLFIFGLTTSRYHPYSEETALEEIDTYWAKGIPLDMFVMDTDWRVGASHGYQINQELFPDMRTFIKRAHARDVYLMFNDHPEPHSDGFLDPAELQYRCDNLTRLLEMGADVWWYDRNWMTHLDEPPEGLPRDVWGQRLYRDVTQRTRPERRPLIMSNVAGIEHGVRKSPPHPAEHQFPIWWTGDTAARWDYLRLGIENGVDYGILGLMPYVNEDLGGHFGDPNAELYVRFVQYGVFSPITRLHCTIEEVRYPWAFGREAEHITTAYLRLRYRLLPTIYTAARRAFDDGTPLLRRCDLEWPDHPQANDPSQYMFGDDLLVAPMNTGENDFEFISAAHLQTGDGNPGLQGEYYANSELEGNPEYIQDEVNLNHDWYWEGAPHGLPGDGFSIRWRGKLVDIPETGEYQMGVYLTGMARITLDGEQLLKKYEGDFTSPVATSVHLEKGRSYELCLEYAKVMPRAVFGLVWLPLSKAGAVPTRSVWLPPGEWMDVWSGTRLVGPQTLQVASELWHTPIYQRAGGLVFSLPQMQRTGERPWDTVIVDAVVPQQDISVTRELYEDDGISNAYMDGEFCRTPVTLSRSGNRFSLQVGGIAGDYPGRLSQRTWCLRLHLPAGEAIAEVKVDGKHLSIAADSRSENDPHARLIEPSHKRNGMPFRGVSTQPGAEGGSMLEVWLPERVTGEAFDIEVTSKK
jgi:hypothetical protein